MTRDGDAPAAGSLHDRNLVLVGMRGCGKTTVGRALARRLGRPFLDLDDALAVLAGDDVDTVLARDGEACLRTWEAEVLGQACGLTGHVIATGGGAVLHGPAFEALAEGAVVVYLSADVDLLVGRARGRPRPPLRPGDLREQTAQLLAERRDLYVKVAQIEVSAGADDPILSILEALGLP